MNTGGYSAWKYSMPAINDSTRLGEKYAPGEKLILLKQTGGMWLAQREGTRGAAWVEARPLTIDGAP